MIIFSCIFLFLGIGMIIGAVLTKISFQKRGQECTQIVDATIVDLNKMERSDDGSTFVSYFPIYEYQYNGKVYRSGSNVGNLKSKFEIGRKVQIYINPQKPEKIYENSNVPKLIVRIFPIISLAALIIALFVYIFFK